ncbi:hypothetical protein GCM10009100_00220 [Thalassospira tepidiphila]
MQALLTEFRGIHAGDIKHLTCNNDGIAVNHLNIAAPGFLSGQISKLGRVVLGRGVSRMDRCAVPVKANGNQGRNGKKDDQADNAFHTGLKDLRGEYLARMTQRSWQKNKQKERQNDDALVR